MDHSHFTVSWSYTSCHGILYTCTYSYCTIYVLYIYTLNLFYSITDIHLYIPLYTQLYLHIPVHTLFTHVVLYIGINILFMHTTYTKVCSHHCAIHLYMQPILHIPSVYRQPQLVCAQTVHTYSSNGA